MGGILLPLPKGGWEGFYLQKPYRMIIFMHKAPSPFPLPAGGRKGVRGRLLFN
jgi:hypothetical protein